MHYPPDGVRSLDPWGLSAIANESIRAVPALLYCASVETGLTASPPPFQIAVGAKGPVKHLCSSYAEGDPDEVFAILGSMGFLEIATNRGSAHQLLGAAKGSEVKVEMESSA
jgi:hypothetical protein